MMRFLLPVALAVALLTGSAVAGAEDDPLDDMGFATTPSGSVGGWRTCVPPSVVNDQAVDVVTNFLRAHPEDRHHSAVSLVLQALAEAFPCPSPTVAR
jgi:hypothetical protein